VGSVLVGRARLVTSPATAFPDDPRCRPSRAESPSPPHAQPPTPVKRFPLWLPATTTSDIPHQQHRCPRPRTSDTLHTVPVLCCGGGGRTLEVELDRPSARCVFEAQSSQVWLPVSPRSRAGSFSSPAGPGPAVSLTSRMSASIFKNLKSRCSLRLRVENSCLKGEACRKSSQML
jgi:hypothetical protein